MQSAFHPSAAHSASTDTTKELADQIVRRRAELATALAENDTAHPLVRDTGVRQLGFFRAMQDVAPAPDHPALDDVVALAVAADSAGMHRSTTFAVVTDPATCASVTLDVGDVAAAVARAGDVVPDLSDFVLQRLPAEEHDAPDDPVLLELERAVAIDDLAAPTGLLNFDLCSATYSADQRATDTAMTQLLAADDQHTLAAESVDREMAAQEAELTAAMSAVTCTTPVAAPDEEPRVHAAVAAALAVRSLTAPDEGHPLHAVVAAARTVRPLTAPDEGHPGHPGHPGHAAVVDVLDVDDGPPAVRPAETTASCAGTPPRPVSPPRGHVVDVLDVDDGPLDVRPAETTASCAGTPPRPVAPTAGRAGKSPAPSSHQRISAAMTKYRRSIMEMTLHHQHVARPLTTAGFVHSSTIPGTKVNEAYLTNSDRFALGGEGDETVRRFVMLVAWLAKRRTTSQPIVPYTRVMGQGVLTNHESTSPYKLYPSFVVGENTSRVHWGVTNERQRQLRDTSTRRWVVTSAVNSVLPRPYIDGSEDVVTVAHLEQLQDVQDVVTAHLLCREALYFKQGEAALCISELTQGNMSYHWDTSIYGQQVRILCDAVARLVQQARYGVHTLYHQYPYESAQDPYAQRLHESEEDSGGEIGYYGLPIPTYAELHQVADALTHFQERVSEVLYSWLAEQQNAHMPSMMQCWGSSTFGVITRTYEVASIHWTENDGQPPEWLVRLALYGHHEAPLRKKAKVLVSCEEYVAQKKARFQLIDHDVERDALKNLAASTTKTFVVPVRRTRCHLLGQEHGCHEFFEMMPLVRYGAADELHMGEPRPTLSDGFVRALCRLSSVGMCFGSNATMRDYEKNATDGDPGRATFKLGELAYEAPSETTQLIRILYTTATTKLRVSAMIPNETVNALLSDRLGDGRRDWSSVHFLRPDQTCPVAREPRHPRERRQGGGRPSGAEGRSAVTNRTPVKKRSVRGGASAREAQGPAKGDGRQGALKTAPRSRRADRDDGGAAAEAAVDAFQLDGALETPLHAQIDAAALVAIAERKGDEKEKDDWGRWREEIVGFYGAMHDQGDGSLDACNVAQMQLRTPDWAQVVWPLKGFDDPAALGEIAAKYIFDNANLWDQTSIQLKDDNSSWYDEEEGSVTSADDLINAVQNAMKKLGNVEVGTMQCRAAVYKVQSTLCTVKTIRTVRLSDNREADQRRRDAAETQDYQWAKLLSELQQLYGDAARGVSNFEGRFPDEVMVLLKKADNLPRVVATALFEEATSPFGADGESTEGVENRIQSTEPVYADENITILDPVSMHGVLVRSRIDPKLRAQIIDEGLLSRNAQLAAGRQPLRHAVLRNIVFFRAPPCRPKISHAAPQPIAERIREEIAETAEGYGYGHEDPADWIYIRVDPDNTRVFFSEINFYTTENFRTNPKWDRRRDPDRFDQEFYANREQFALDCHAECSLTLSQYWELLDTQKVQKEHERRNKGKPFWNLCEAGRLEYFAKPPSFPWNEHDIDLNTEIWAKYRVDPSWFVPV